MKNIYLIQTEEPSILWESKHGRLYYNQANFNDPDECKNLNIYITSDEEIKEGDYYFDSLVHFALINHPLKHSGVEYPNGDKSRIIQSTTGTTSPIGTSSKIILTTDQDLINDGVQAIDDDFLEWFVKNPSCEKVEVRIIKEPFNRTSDKYDFYQIIIPKEEPKHSKVFSENGNELFFDEQGNLIKEELKQEIIEESAEKIRQNSFMCCGLSKQIDYVTVGEREKVAFISGAEWQVRRNYSEKEVIDLLTFVNDRLPDLYSRFSPEDELKEWFEQNKKK